MNDSVKSWYIARLNVFVQCQGKPIRPTTCDTGISGNPHRSFEGFLIPFVYFNLEFTETDSTIVWCPATNVLLWSRIMKLKQYYKKTRQVVNIMLNEHICQNKISWGNVYASFTHIHIPSFAFNNTSSAISYITQISLSYKKTSTYVVLTNLDIITIWV